MFKKIFISLFVLLCVGCAKEGTYVPSLNAKDDFEIEFLFEQDGVKIYRFIDKGRTRYFATGNGRMTDSTYVRNKGKNGSVIIDDTLIQ
jgi:hypothetical protein